MANREFTSVIPENHYKIVEARRNKRISGHTKGKTWEEIQDNLKRNMYSKLSIEPDALILKRK